MTAVVIDASVWIDYLRGADTTARTRLRRRLVAEDVDIMMTEPVAMELLAGPSSERVAAAIGRLVDGLPQLAVETTADFRSAAAIYRACRRAGRTVRNLSDCLIAAIAIRHDVTLIHKDADFESIGAVTPLRHEYWG